MDLKEDPLWEGGSKVCYLPQQSHLATVGFVIDDVEKEIISVNHKIMTGPKQCVSWSYNTMSNGKCNFSWVQIFE